MFLPPGTVGCISTRHRAGPRSVIIPGVIFSGPQPRSSLVTWFPRRPILQSFILSPWLGSHGSFAILGHYGTGQPNAWPSSAVRRGSLQLPAANAPCEGPSLSQTAGPKWKVTRVSEGEGGGIAGCRRPAPQSGQNRMAAPRNLVCPSLWGAEIKAQRKQEV